MICVGKCYCGNICVLDHELVCSRCDCDNNHKSCKEKCLYHIDEICIWIANHNGSHDCFECAKGNIK